MAWRETRGFIMSPISSQKGCTTLVWDSCHWLCLWREEDRRSCTGILRLTKIFSLQHGTSHSTYEHEGDPRQQKLSSSSPENVLQPLNEGYSAVVSGPSTRQFSLQTTRLTTPGINRNLQMLLGKKSIHHWWTEQTKSQNHCISFRLHTGVFYFLNAFLQWILFSLL